MVLLSSSCHPAPPAANADEEPISTLVARVIHEAGGAERIASLSAIRFDGRFELFENGSILSGGVFRTLIAFPDRLYQIRQFDNGARLIRVLDGESGSLEVGGEGMPLDAPLKAELEAYLRSRYVSLLRELVARSDPARDVAFEDGAVFPDGVRIEDLGERVEDGVTLRRVVLVDGAERIEFGLDVENAQLHRAGGSLTQTEAGTSYTQFFSDFRRVDGLLVPYDTDSRTDDLPYSRRRCETIVVNPPVDESMFVLAAVD